MKSYRIYLAISLISTVLILAGFFAYDSMRQKRLKTDAFAQMESVSSDIFQMRTRTMQVPHSTPPIEIPRSEMKNIMGLDNFAGIDVQTLAISIPMLFSRQDPIAQFSALGHFTRGTHRINASMIYQDGQWQFIEFVILPGERAQ